MVRNVIRKTKANFAPWGFLLLFGISTFAGDDCPVAQPGYSFRTVTCQIEPSYFKPAESFASFDIYLKGSDIAEICKKSDPVKVAPVFPINAWVTTARKQKIDASENETFRYSMPSELTVKPEGDILVRFVQDGVTYSLTYKLGEWGEHEAVLERDTGNRSIYRCNLFPLCRRSVHF